MPPASLEPTGLCPVCRAVVPRAARQCPSCRATFEAPEPAQVHVVRRDADPSAPQPEAPPLSGVARAILAAGGILGAVVAWVAATAPTQALGSGDFGAFRDATSFALGLGFAAALVAVAIVGLTARRPDGWGPAALAAVLGAVVGLAGAFAVTMAADVATSPVGSFFFVFFLFFHPAILLGLVLVVTSVVALVVGVALGGDGRWLLRGAAFVAGNVASTLLVGGAWLVGNRERLEAARRDSPGLEVALVVLAVAALALARQRRR